jgi:hypothetical protein
VTNGREAEGKPTSGSVTGVACACGYLERASGEPDNPIVFDAEMNEYHLRHFDHAGLGRQGESIIYHCPFCGGVAPRSKRSSFFAQITDAEKSRLRDLTSGAKTVRDAVAQLGQPNEDHPDGFTTESRSSDAEPSVIKSYRLLRYTGLSETANVTFTDSGPDGGLRMRLESKYLGKPKA